MCCVGLAWKYESQSAVSQYGRAWRTIVASGKVHPDDALFQWRIDLSLPLSGAQGNVAETCEVVWILSAVKQRRGTPSAEKVCFSSADALILWRLFCAAAWTAHSTSVVQVELFVFQKAGLIKIPSLVQLVGWLFWTEANQPLVTFELQPRNQGKWIRLIRCATNN